MTRHYFTQNINIDAGDSFVQFKGTLGWSIVIEKVFLALTPATVTEAPTIEIAGLDHTVDAGDTVDIPLVFSPTDILYLEIPISGRSTQGRSVSFNLIGSGGPSLSGVVSGYYTDE